jgi:integrase
MSIAKLPSGRWRAQAYDSVTGKNLSVSKIIGGPGTFANKTEAKRAREEACGRLREPRSREVTVVAFWERWTPIPCSPGRRTPRSSTIASGREPLSSAMEPGASIKWTMRSSASGLRGASTTALSRRCEPCNDAASAKARRLVRSNPFARLWISKGPGRRHEQPPSEERVWKLIRCARELASPSFAAWLQVAAFTGLRPGELDALRRANVDLGRSRVLVVEQFNAKTRTFTLPKNGLTREAPLTDPAREAIMALPVESEFCFVSIRGEHWTSARAYHWEAVKVAAGWDGSLYLATRHFAGWYMVNVLDVPSEDVAIALGHTDGGELVRRLYGHRDHERALDRVTAAYGRTANFTQVSLW